MRKRTSTNYQNEQQLQRCPVAYTLGLIGGRWKAIILWELSKQPGRFSELNRAIAGASERMLAKQLKELLTDGLISKQEQKGVQVYTLTEFGHSLQPVLNTILQWGLANYNRS